MKKLKKISEPRRGIRIWSQAKLDDGINVRLLSELIHITLTNATQKIFLLLCSAASVFVNVICPVLIFQVKSFGLQCQTGVNRSPNAAIPSGYCCHHQDPPDLLFRHYSPRVPTSVSAIPGHIRRRYAHRCGLGIGSLIYFSLRCPVSNYTRNTVLIKQEQSPLYHCIGWQHQIR